MGEIMKLQELFTDDSAVSPVIGVILMVAITVLLAATAASFFLGISEDSQTETPTVAVSFNYDVENESSGIRDDSLTIVHSGGDSVQAENVDISVRDAVTGSNVVNDRRTWNEWGSGSDVSEIVAGSAVRIDRSKFGGTGLSLDQAKAQVVWDDPSSSQTFILAEWEAPTAGSN